jgi:hypothetical protein
MLQEEQIKEIIRCRRDPIYLNTQYGFMRHPAFDFPIRFIPWDWQETMAWLWLYDYSTILLKSRQLGFSWTIAWYVNSVINFTPGVEIPLLSSNEDKAKELLGKVVFYYDHLPAWMRAHQVERSKTRFAVRMRYYDGVMKKWRWGVSTVSSLTTTGTSGAGLSAKRVYIDEFGLFGETGRKGMDEAAYASIAPTTIHGGRVAMGSTPRGYGGAFHRIWVEVISPLVNAGVIDDFMPYREWNRAILDNLHLMDMVPIKAHYSMAYHDEEWLQKACRGFSKLKQIKIREYFEGLVYDEAWRDEQAGRLKLSKPKMLQEFELYFEQTGNPAFAAEDLHACYKPRTDSQVQGWIEDSKSYFIGVDTAEGISKKNTEPDYHSLVVMNDFGVQVDAEHNRKPLSEWAGASIKDPKTDKLVEFKGTVLKMIEKYSPSEVLVEKNGPGLTVVNRIQPLMPQDARLIVESMSGALKPRLVSDLQMALQERRICITDYFTYQTMMQYSIVGPGKYEAAPGFYDDPVVAMLWAVYLMNTSGAYHIPWGADGSSEGQRAVGSKLEEDMTPAELEVIRAEQGPDFTSLPIVDGGTNLRETDRRPFRGQGRSNRRWIDDSKNVRRRRVR